MSPSSRSHHHSGHCMAWHPKHCLLIPCMFWIQYFEVLYAGRIQLKANWGAHGHPFPSTASGLTRMWGTFVTIRECWAAYLLNAGVAGACLRTYIKWHYWLSNVEHAVIFMFVQRLLHLTLDMPYGMSRWSMIWPAVLLVICWMGLSSNLPCPGHFITDQLMHPHASYLSMLICWWWLAIANACSFIWLIQCLLVISRCTIYGYACDHFMRHPYGTGKHNVIDGRRQNKLH